MRLPIVMRPAQREHLPAIRAINAESVPGVSLLTARDLNRITEAASIVVVALLNESVAGYSVGYAADAAYAGEEFQWFLCRGRDFLYVDQIAVAVSHRSRGIGAALYQELAQFAERNQLRSLVCEVNVEPPNPRSMAFHARQGFDEVGRLLTTDGRYVALLQRRGQAPQ